MNSLPTAPSGPPDEALIASAAQSLRAGKLIGLPTETVYGIGAALTSSSALAALQQLLNIQGRPAWVIHVASTNGPSAYVARIAPLARRLMKRLWPGPVAIQVLPDAGDMSRLQALLGQSGADAALTDGYLTFRCTETEITRRMIAVAETPVTIMGAAGNQRIERAENLPPTIREQLAVVISGPPPRYEQPSTLIRIRGDVLDVLREGAVAERVIQRSAEMVLVFVCSGNTCRSPMAAGLASRLLAEKLGIPLSELPRRHLVIRSAGLYASSGMPAAPEAVRAAAELGADIQKHRSAPLTDELLRRADMIYTMTQSHRDDIVSRSPLAGERTVTLDPDGDIDDPIGRGEQVYRRTARRIEHLIGKRLAELEL